MAIREILIFPDDRLRQVARPVADPTAPEVPELVQDLADTMYHAPGVGLVRVGARGGDSREYLHLVAVTHLGPASMVRVRAAALTMEQRAYRVSEVYRVTPHATGGPG